ncbi:MAG TPA: cytochrome c biogenesis protein CcdA, partial [Candidatus Acidoferrum sp.]|nr:cytochrome c biogenesis protein CcdA [Candidatus Acidoferrum sp.]
MRMRRVVLVGGALAMLALLFIFPRLAWAAGEQGAEFQKQLDDRGYLLVYLSCFGLGIMASLTPCVYPMIPIVVGVFGARDESATRRRAFALASAYVLGMGLVYSALGLIFALLGKAGDQGQLLANPVVVVPLVLVYAALAASMFGAFELNLPSGLQQRLAQVGGRGYAGAFTMGMVGGFTAAPCTGPFLAGLLGWVAMSGRPVIGGSMLFTFALGMGVLFWVIAATSVSLPKSGRWMEWVKSIGGIALLAVGIYFLRPLVPAIESMASPSVLFLLGALFVVAIGIALGAVHLTFHGRPGEKVRKAAGVLLTVVGVTGAINWAVTADRKLPWYHDEAPAFSQARTEGKGVLLDFSATWCVPCKELEVKTFASRDVYERILASYVPLKFDVTEDNPTNEARKEKYGQSTMPEVIFLDAGGRVLERVHGLIGPDEFMQRLDRADEARRKP